MDRPGTHALPKAQVGRKLRSLGLSVKGVEASRRFDFLVNDSIRVTLRTAFPSAYRREVTVGPRSYRYSYRAWNFNFHHRGKIEERYCDFFVCVPMDDQRARMDTAYVIPWSARTGKTFYLPDSTRPYGGKYARFRGAWEQIVAAAAAPSESTPQRA